MKLQCVYHVGFLLTLKCLLNEKFRSHIFEQKARYLNNTFKKWFAYFLGYGWTKVDSWRSLSQNRDRLGSNIRS